MTESTMRLLLIALARTLSDVRQGQCHQRDCRFFPPVSTCRGACAEARQAIACACHELGEDVTKYLGDPPPVASRKR